MGIPGLHGLWLQKYANVAVLRNLPANVKVSSLSIDLNSILHTIASQVYGYADNITSREREVISKKSSSDLYATFLLNLEETLKFLVNLINPIDTFVLAVDGLAPQAKIQQQRQRRFKSRANKETEGLFNSNAITPGTDFMFQLDLDLQSFIAKNFNPLPPKIIYSSHMSPGEAEHKIADMFRNKEVSGDGIHVLYGIDADLIIISLLSPLNRIYLFREDTRNKTIDVVDIDRLALYLIKRTNKARAVKDFAILMSMMGNDFLPTIPSMEAMDNGIEYLLNVYSKDDYIIFHEQKGIDWNGLAQYLSDLSKFEGELLERVASRLTIENPFPALSNSVKNGKVDVNEFRQRWFNKILGARGQKRYQEDVLELINYYVAEEDDILMYGETAKKPIITLTSMNDKIVDNLTYDYLKTMAWVSIYYNSGPKVINEEWSYSHFYAPLLVDLAVISGRIADGKLNVFGLKRIPGMISFTVLHQLIAVMPPQSKDLIPAELLPLLDRDSPIYDLFPDTFVTDAEGKRVINKNGRKIIPSEIALVPFPDRRRIYLAVSRIKFTIRSASRYLPQKDFVYLKSPKEIEEYERLIFQSSRREDIRNERRRDQSSRKDETKQSGILVKRREESRLKKTVRIETPKEKKEEIEEEREEPKSRTIQDQNVQRTKSGSGRSKEKRREGRREWEGKTLAERKRDWNKLDILM